eukprot:jgi/Mesvir1/16330/Mv25165-RA.1
MAGRLSTPVHHSQTQPPTQSGSGKCSAGAHRVQGLCRLQVIKAPVGPIPRHMAPAGRLPCAKLRRSLL